MRLRIIIITGLIAASLALAGCSSGGQSGTPEPVPAVNTTSQDQADTFPLVFQNCDLESTFTKAPQRIVTLNQSAAEVLIKLGVSDRIVGTGSEIYAVPDDVATEYNKIPQLAEHGDAVSHEALLSVQPDFVYSQLVSMFSADRAGERSELHSLGIPTYQSEFECSYHESIDNASFELLFEEFKNLAAILDVPENGERLVAEQQAVVAAGLATAKQIQGTPTLVWFYSTYGGTPYVAGPGGMPQHITDLINAKNVFDDATNKWPETSWDEVAARNPDVIILADLTRGMPGDTATEKIAMLKSDPLTSQLDAVKNDQFIIVPGRYMDPSYGSVYALTAVAEGLVGLQ